MSYRKLNAHPLNSLLRSTFARAAAGALGAAAPLAVLANPTGGQVVGGTATIGSAGANGVVITQGSQKAIINWQQFSVGSNEYVQFIQPNSSSVVLNRVIGSNPSNIFGNIIANGQVFLVNANGVYFAPGASIDVQGLVASTLDLNDADFMAGRYVFSKPTGASDAGVVNDASIHAGPGGYVVLAGDYAQNGGAIVAQTGRVYLAAGNAATLTFDNNGLISYVVDGKTLSRLAGVSNTGVIAANGGLVVMTADVANTLTATAVNNSGLITAHSVSQEGGEIVLSAQGGGEIENSGTLDATGLGSGVAGGTIIIHGDGHTLLDPTSVVDVSGDGAKGGFIELSGHTLGVRGKVTIGRGGRLLIDPAVIKIVDGTGQNSQSVGTTSIGTGVINQDLALSGSVALVASHSIIFSGTAGDTIHSTTPAGLTLAIGTVTGPSCGIGGVCAADGATPSISHTAGGGTITLTGLGINIAGKLVIDAGGNADSGGVITTDNLKAKSVELVADKITVNGNITATGGDVSIFGHSGNSDNLTVTGNVTAAGRFVASFSNEGGAGIGSVNLKNVTATGIVVLASHINATGTLHANGSGTAAGSKDVVLRSQHEFNSAGGAGIAVGKIISDNGNVTLSASGNAAAASIGNISAGAITAHQNVTITANAGAVGGGNVNVGAISAGTGGVHITASNTGGFHNSLKTGNITAGDTVTIFYKGGGHDASGGVTVKLGNVDSQRSTSIQASDTSNAPLVVKTGTLTNHKGSASNGQGIQVTLTGADPLFSAAGITNLAGHGSKSCDCDWADIRVQLNTTNGSSGNIKVTGAIKSNTGIVSLSASNAAINVGSVSGRDVSMNARTIAFGNVTAASSVNITANNGHHSSGVNIINAATGTTITGRFINIDLNASYGGIMNLSNLAASSANGQAGISLIARSAQGGNSIVVNGNITVNGKGSNNGFSSGMPGIGAPKAAFLDIQASGSTAFAHDVKVNGNIGVTAHGGNFNIHACSGECGPRLSASGVGGAAEVSIVADDGSAQILGTTTVKGTDAELNIQSPIIKTGAITVAGSGHTLALNVSGPGGNGASLASNNNMGKAEVTLTGSHGASGTAITTGNISVTGKGSAVVEMGARSITAGNITVVATTATGTRRLNSNSNHSLAHFGVGSDVPGLFGLQMSSGSFTAGRAGVFLGASAGSHGSRSSPAQTIKVGNVSVTGVGEADIDIVGHSITAGSLNATAASGKMKGHFSSGGEAGHFHQTFNIVGGEADIQVEGGSASNTTITVNGAVSATGPVASVNMFGTTIKVSKGITVSGKGGQAVVSGSGTGGSGFTQKFTGPGPITGISIGGEGSHNAASINIGGVVSAKGPGVIGIAITGAKVTLGGLSASASNVATYKIVSTSDGVNDTFTAGSVAVVVFDESGGAITGPAKINGNVTISAPHGNVSLGAQLNVTGQVKVSAAGNVTDDVSAIVNRIGEISDVTGGNGSSGGSNHGPGIPSSGVPLKLAGAGISMTATAGSIDLTGATLTTPTTGAVTLKAGKDIILSGVTINVGTLSANAGSTIHNGGAIGTITANGLALTAGKNINLSSTQINVGKGSVASLASDPTLLQALAAAGLSPGTPKPNAYFNAGGTLTLGKLTLTGNYMYLQGANITLLGPVSTPAGSVIQLAPTTGPATIGVEGQPGTGSVLNLSNSLLLSLFPGTTLVIGNGAETGAVTLGSAGPFDIGSSNLIIDTTGTVTGLDNVTSTGLISTVESLLASALAPPTPSEIDPNSTNNNNAAGKHHAPGSEDPNAGTTGGTISQSTDAGGACH